jgi:hypothetical protein
VNPTLAFFIYRRSVCLPDELNDPAQQVQLGFLTAKEEVKRKLERWIEKREGLKESSSGGRISQPCSR